MKSLGYPMALTTLDQESWRKILSPVLQVCLPKAGFVSSFPQRFILAPLSLQGAGIPHPFAEQVCAHLDMLLRHPANRSKTNTYLDANIQAHQLETGTSFGIFQQTYENTAILTSDTSFASDSPGLDLNCDGDAFLMELFMDLQVDQPTLMWLNWCRLYLHVCTVSDIVTADGRYIRRSVLEGIHDSPTVKRYQWPRTARPATTHWDSWRHHLSLALLSTSSLTSPLRQPLGYWTDDVECWNWRAKACFILRAPYGITPPRLPPLPGLKNLTWRLQHGGVRPSQLTSAKPLSTAPPIRRRSN